MQDNGDRPRDIDAGILPSGWPPHIWILQTIQTSECGGDCVTNGRAGGWRSGDCRQAEQALAQDASGCPGMECSRPLHRQHAAFPCYEHY